MIDSISNDDLVSPFPMQKQFFIPTNPGERIQDHYDLSKLLVLGEGSYGKVVKAMRKGKCHLRAIKIISKSKVTDPEKFKTEIAILKDLDHPNVIKLYEIYEDAENIYLVMELCQGGELLERMRSREIEYFKEDEARIVFKQIISAINYCHAKKICHRDLKPENFLYSTKEENSPIKIIDFGLSKIFHQDSKTEIKSINMKSLSGTMAFLAPEILSGSYDEKVDIWSAGVILYYMLCGYLPFLGDGPEVLIAIKHLDYNFYGPEFKAVSNECKNLIRSILTTADKRITLENLMKDPWLYPQSIGSPKKQMINLNLSIGHRISKFKSYGKLKKSLLCYIASQLTEQEIGELREVFLALADKDGRITFTQFEKAFDNAKFMNKEKESLKLAFEGMDVNQKGMIDYTEFLAAAIPEEIYLKEDKINSAFLMFDRDKTGKVSKNELKKTLGKHVYYESKEDTYWEKIMEDSDHNKDGYLDPEDFMSVLQKD